MVAATIDELSDYLVDGFSTKTLWNLGSSGVNAQNGVITYNVEGFTNVTINSEVFSDSNGLDAAREDLVRAAFEYYSLITGITFVEVTTADADFVFTDNDGGAYSFSEHDYDFGAGEFYTEQTLINIDDTWYGGLDGFDDYTWQTILHEIGHSLGLGHQGDYNGAANYPTNATFENDSWQVSIMSYFSQDDNTTIDASYAFLLGLAPSDFLALEKLYGDFGYGPSQAFLGDTTYGFNTTISSADSEPWSNLVDYADNMSFTIVDGGGIDTLDFSGYSQSNRIDITITQASFTQATTSDIGNMIGNMSLAVGTVIENVIGGSGADDITGNSVDNELYGGGGADVIFGAEGNDTIYGGSGVDYVEFLYDLFVYTVEYFVDYFTIEGEGIDLVYDDIEYFVFSEVTYTYEELAEIFANTAPTPIADTADTSFDSSVSGNVLDNDTDPENDPLTLISIEGDSDGEVTLASGAIVTFLSDGSYTYDPNGAFDGLTTDATDTFTYTVSDGSADTSTETVTITITPVPAGAILGDEFENRLDGTENDDVFYAFEEDDDIFGGDGNDEIYAGSGADYVVAGNDDDLIYGAEGADRIYAGAGVDTVYGGDDADAVYGGTGADIIETGEGSDRVFGGEDGDTIKGGAGNDTLRGEAGNDNIMGEDGADYIDGGDGEDDLYGGNDRDRLFGGIGADLLVAGEGNDIAFGGSGNDEIYGDAGLDYIYAGDGADEVYGGNDNDQIRGEEGDDTLSGDLGNDTIVGGTGIDTIYGGDGRDRLFGGDENDFIYGGDGADQIYGGEGNDEIFTGNGGVIAFGDAGEDTITGGDDNDKLRGGDDDDTIYGGGGNDYIEGGEGNDLLYSSTGKDRLYGNAGTDELYAGTGDTTMYGGDDADMLFAGSGVDLMYGGAGADEFNFVTNGENRDRIQDFEIGIDSIQLDASAVSYDDLTFRQAGTSVLITHEDSDLEVLVKDVDLVNLTEDHFEFI